MEKEIIVSITEVEIDIFSGYIVKTNLQVIQILIENGQQCCEKAGYMTTSDDIDSFLQAEIHNIHITDESLNTKKYNPANIYKGECTFLNIDTNKGTLQFVVYNEHNGYYGHKIMIKSNQVTKTGYI